MELVLSFLALVLSLVAIGIAVRFYFLEKEQGERLGLSVISTVDQIYRQIRDRDVDESEEDLDYEYVASRSQPQFIRRNEDVALTLQMVVWDPSDGHLETYAECIVERPSRVRDRIKHVVDLSAKEYIAVYPGDFPEGSTDDPGRYHVRWRLTQEYKLVTPSTGHEEHRVDRLGSSEDSFGVMP